MSTKVIEWLLSKTISLLNTCAVVTNSGTSEFAEGQRAEATEGRWVLMGVWQMSLLPIWLTEWLITAGGGEELRMGRGSDCNEGWEVVGVWRWRLINHIDWEWLEGQQHPWRTTHPLCCARSVTPTDDLITDRCARKCKWHPRIYMRQRRCQHGTAHR